jgi:carbon storage regulator
MLIITRRPGQRVMVGDDVIIAVVDVKGANVRIGIEAPKDVPIYREEVLPERAADGPRTEQPPD